ETVRPTRRRNALGGVVSCIAPLGVRHVNEPARELHPERSLADHDNPLAMDPAWLAAHRVLDKAVENAFAPRAIALARDPAHPRPQRPEPRSPRQPRARRLREPGPRRTARPPDRPRGPARRDRPAPDGRRGGAHPLAPRG